MSTKVNKSDKVNKESNDSKVGGKKALTVEEQYTKKSLHQHIYDLPDTQIGSIEGDTINMFVYDDDENKITKKDKFIVMGLYKIVDEILVNAADNTIRDPNCNEIKVTINKETGEISVENNGSTIPIEIHKEEKIYVPEMIFGTLLTSGNYDQTGKIVGGRNGVGSKVANIFSKRFDIEIVDNVRNLKYYQRFTENMFKKEEPVITKLSKKKNESYTKISFIPDYKKFGLEGLTDDMISLIKRRVYDIAGTTNNTVKVYYNNELINIKSFEDYIKLFYNDEEDDKLKLVYTKYNERWEVGIVFDPNAGYQHMSFVNRISTFLGGTHINYVVGQIVDKITAIIKEKNKNLNIRPSQIKDCITVFINSVVEDPSFSSQSKETLTTKASTFNIKCEIDDKFIAKLCKTGLYDEIVQSAQVKQLAELEKSDGKKGASVRKLVKLNDAKWAGTKNSSQCRLILTEGDSAKTFALSGLDIIGNEKFGVFPLRGKLLNVRDATPKQLLANEEIKNLKQIIGLKQNSVYKDTKNLRYGGIIILTDSDYDGSHIKGLLMNFFHFFWPSLLKIDGFIQTLATPIIKVFKKSDKKNAYREFFTQTEYKDWITSIGDEKRTYEIKYYKGLGTSTDKEAKECFTDFNKKIVNYAWMNLDDDDSDDESIDGSDNQEEGSTIHEGEEGSIKSDASNDKNSKSYQSLLLAFAKQKANDRKLWLKDYKPELILNNDNKKITFDEFINKDLIHFSNSDNIRSIPNLVDGLKPSQRKILYGSIKRKLYNQEIKVSQLSGYIAEHTEYHHGENSLQGAIINMAQDYCGSNNINLLNPNGNFGTRRLGGKDHASPRYIFTQLNDITKHIFKGDDEYILDYNYEDGVQIEPEKYYPILPMVLVNGSEGIGTGYSTFIPCYNPLDIINNIKLKLQNKKDDSELVPWYKGFKGKINKVNEDTWSIVGKYEIINENKLIITELPVGTWTESYREFLESLVDDGTIISNYDDNSGIANINITIHFVNNALQQLLKTNTLEKKLKLVSTIRTSNMHLYKDNVIVKYKNANAILDDFIKIRLHAYKIRKEYIIKVLEREMAVINYRKKFIEQILNKEIVIERKKKVEIIARLVELKYPELSTGESAKSSTLVDAPKGSYDYLTTLPLWCLTQEKIDDMNKEYNEKKHELDTYTSTSIEELWSTEITKIEDIYNKLLIHCDTTINKDTKVSKGKKSKNVVAKK
jgi:DNA topoisomerase-2